MWTAGGRHTWKNRAHQCAPRSTCWPAGRPAARTSAHIRIWGLVSLAHRAHLISLMSPVSLVSLARAAAHAQAPGRAPAAYFEFAISDPPRSDLPRRPRVVVPHRLRKKRSVSESVSELCCGSWAGGRGCEVEGSRSRGWRCSHGFCRMRKAAGRA